MLALPFHDGSVTVTADFYRASTLTQQRVKNFVHSPASALTGVKRPVSWTRYSKDHILELYMNEVNNLSQTATTRKSVFAGRPIEKWYRPQGHIEGMVKGVRGKLALERRNGTVCCNSNKIIDQNSMTCCSHTIRYGRKPRGEVISPQPALLCVEATGDKIKDSLGVALLP